MSRPEQGRLQQKKRKSRTGAQKVDNGMFIIVEEKAKFPLISHGRWEDLTVNDEVVLVVLKI